MKLAKRGRGRLQAIGGLLGLFPAAAFAAGAHATDHAIPVNLIIAQALNFGALLLILGYILRPEVKDYFRTRQETFTQLVRQARRAKEEAERQKQEINDRLRKLEASAEESLKQARIEAEEMRQKLISEAQLHGQKLEQEALRTAGFEAEKAHAEVREELLDRAFALARKTLQERMGANDQKRLQSEFVEKIQVVQ